MRKVDKITVLYDEGEDRLNLLAQDSAGVVTSCWLTQRLANRLVRSLVQRLATEAVPGAVVTQPAPPRLQALEQAAAQMQMPRLPPVEPEAQPAATPALVHSLQVGRTARGRHSVVFRWGREEQAIQLIMDSTRLRQWLGIVYRHYVKAEWPRDGVWPQWFEPGKAEADPAMPVLLH